MSGTKERCIERLSSSEVTDHPGPPGSVLVLILRNPAVLGKPGREVTLPSAHLTVLFPVKLVFSLHSGQLAHQHTTFEMLF